MSHLLLSLQSTQGLVIWVAVTPFLETVVCSQVQGRVIQYPELWSSELLWWATVAKTSLCRTETMRVCLNLQLFLEGRPMFEMGAVSPMGVVVCKSNMGFPKRKSGCTCRQMRERPLQRNRGGMWPMYAHGGVDGPKSETGRLDHVVYAVWFLDGDFRNVTRTVPPQERQSITRAELRAAPHALQHKQTRHAIVYCNRFRVGVFGVNAQMQKMAETVVGRFTRQAVTHRFVAGAVGGLEIVW